LLIKCWKAVEDFGAEAIIPLWGNYVGAKVGDKITFDVAAFSQEGEGVPRPMATNVVLRQRGTPVGEGVLRGPAQTDVGTQVLYYLSDDNLRTDKFFQDIIAATEGGWIGTKFLLLCSRLKKLGASTRSIIESMQDAPGVEVRDVPGLEAVRRTSAPPPLEAWVAAKFADSKQSAAIAIADMAGRPVIAKKTYTKAMMTLLGNPAKKGAEAPKELKQRKQKKLIK